MFFIIKFKRHFVTGQVKTFAQTSFLEAWRIHQTILKSWFRNRSDKNQPSKFIYLGISPPVYYTDLDSCSKTAKQCNPADRLKFQPTNLKQKGLDCWILPILCPVFNSFSKVKVMTVIKVNPTISLGWKCFLLKLYAARNKTSIHRVLRVLMNVCAPLATPFTPTPRNTHDHPPPSILSLLSPPYTLLQPPLYHAESSISLPLLQQQHTYTPEHSQWPAKLTKTSWSPV